MEMKIIPFIHLYPLLSNTWTDSQQVEKRLKSRLIFYQNIFDWNSNFDQSKAKKRKKENEINYKPLRNKGEKMVLLECELKEKSRV